jgi:hypothetical protein
MALVLAWPLVAGLFLLRPRPWLVAGYAIVAGLLLRWVHVPGGGSDVLIATWEAIDTALKGESPYAHFYALTRPQGSPFPYPPLQLLVYLPGYLLGGMQGVQITELWASAAVMGALAVLAARISWLAGLPGLALYATLGNLANLTTDASNDTTTGALILLALLAVAYAALRGWEDAPVIVAGICAALAVGTKQTAALVLVGAAAYVWRTAGTRAAGRYMGSAAIVLAVVSVPFLAMDASAYIRSLVSFAGFHDDVYGWNIWVLAGQLGWPVWDKGSATILNLGVILVGLALLLRYRATGLAGAAGAGVLLAMVAFLTARWTTYAYFAELAPVLCAIPLLHRWERALIPAETAERAALG